VSESIDQVKARLSAKYLGKAGIHAIGIQPGSVLSVYHSGSRPEDLNNVFAQIEREAIPFSVRFFKEPPPRAAGS
jgi:hypothetical protein